MDGTLAFSRSRLPLLIALFLLLVATPANTAVAVQSDDRAAFTLFAAVDEGRQYRPIDPLTLEDMTTAEPLVFDREWTNMAVSGDGSAFVVIDPAQGPLEDWISVRDGVNGPERLTITTEEAVFNPRLSDDGARLVVEPQLICGPSGCDERVWYTYDTNTGELISTIRSDAGDPVWPDLIDPAGQRLYQPFYEGPPPPTYPATPTPVHISEVGPWPLQIAAYDLTTGHEVDRITVPDVFAGSWQGESAESVSAMYVGEIVHPAIALSPDGTTIAVVDAPMETLTLIDTATLEIVETPDVHASESLTSRLLTWLGIAPRTAQAKASEGRMLSATFSVDGQHLYLSGNEIEIGDTIEDITGHGFGLLQIDVNNGEITGEALTGAELADVIPSPDGRSLYALGPKTPWWESDGQSPDYVLYRLDAQTLEPLAERTFSSWPNIELIPIDAGG
jgi:hypothetical protein